MEVLPFSGVRCVADAKCSQQGSGTPFRYDGSSKHLEHGEQVEEADLQGDSSMAKDEGPQEGRDVGGQWASDGPMSEGWSDGSSNSEFSENSQLMVDTIEGEPIANQEMEAHLPDIKWLEEDKPLAVWVKWRGRWQAGIKCARADWPLSTLKAKPTLDRKKHLVIFFPLSRNYFWADMLLIRPINEFPQPIAYKTHKIGMRVVEDLTLAHRFIMQKLAVSILDILEQLKREALVETARNVLNWKEFAMEASQCKGYSDLGRMLTKLQNMMLHCYFSPNWLQNSLQCWIQQCHSASSAESVELLKKELVDSVRWTEVSSLSDKAGATQLELGYEPKTWKDEVMKWFSLLLPITSNGDPEQMYNDNALAAGLQSSRKRPKLEVRRAEVHGSQVELRSSHQNETVEIDCGFFKGCNLNSVLLGYEPAKEETGLMEASLTGFSVHGADIVVEAGSDVIQTKDLELKPINDATKPVDPLKKDRQCVAFIEAKGRQCERWASDSEVYCCVHLASHLVGSSSKSEAAPPVDSTMCEGTTVLGTKCKHRSLLGSPFCKKHQPRDGRTITLGSPGNKMGRKQQDLANKAETSNGSKVLPEAANEGSLWLAPISVVSQESLDQSIVVHKQNQKENDGIEVFRCIGFYSQDDYQPCLESAKKFSLYCEKHLPSWLKRARNGKSRAVSKEVFLELLKDCHSREQKLHLHQACELFYKLLKSILSLRNPVPKEVQFQWALSEASKDVGVMEELKRLVCSEKARLKRIWGFGADESTPGSSSIHKSVPDLISNNGNPEITNIIKCNICSEKFANDQVLGSHWMENHKKEAQWLFRGYVCALCLDSFTNTKSLESHVQERHCVQFVEQCMLFQCIPCGGHFGNAEELWSHVLSAHSDNFRLANAAQQPTSIAQDSLRKPEPHKSTSVHHVNSDHQSGTRKFVCRFCGLKFDLLPDLGRHHQAAHMGPNSDGPRPQKRGIRFHAYNLKSARPSWPKFKKGLASSSYRTKNRNAQNLKKRIHASNSNVEVRVQPSQSEASGQGRLLDGQCSTIAKVLFSEMKKTKHHPSNSDILSIAQSTCCKTYLQASLEAKYGMLPKRIYLQAAKLCSEHNILITWHQDGFICPRGCRPNVDPHLLSPLVPIPSHVVRSGSSLLSNHPTSEWAMDEHHVVIDSQHFSQEATDKIVLCDDISFGQESVPIACVVDENILGSLHIPADGSDCQTSAETLPWESFSYITKSLLDQSTGIEVESAQLGCNCEHQCSPDSCDHVYLFDNDYEDAKDTYGKPMHGRFPYDERGRIILEEGYLVYECNQRCSCSKSCQNRVLQNGVQVKLEVFKTEKKGWAVRAREAILRGTFICEYVGEVISDQEANERRKRYGEQHCRYSYEIDAHVNDMSRLMEGQLSYVIDATYHGNVSRYINHSCLPNIENHQVLVESMDCQLAHIGLFASRDISAGEELTYNYRYKLSEADEFPCFCGASNCRGRLY